MGWIQSKIPNLPITNFTSDWNDGRAIGALVDGVAPGQFIFILFIIFYSFFKILNSINLIFNLIFNLIIFNSF